MRRHLVELIIVILSAIVIGALAFGREAARNALPHSTYSSNDTGPNGYRALYEMLHSAGVPVTRFSRVLGVLDSHVGTLVLATYAPDPDPQPMGASDTALLKDFVERGGRLVVLDYDFEGSDDIIPGVAKGTAAKTTDAISLARDSYTDGVRTVAGPIESVFPFATRIGVPLLANDTGIVAIAYPIGKGTVIAITAPALFSNAHLASADNARFAYNVIDGNGPVVFDEYVHGYNDGLSFWGALPMPVRAATYILGAILLDRADRRQRSVRADDSARTAGRTRFVGVHRRDGRVDAPRARGAGRGRCVCGRRGALPARRRAGAAGAEPSRAAAPPYPIPPTRRW